VTGFLKNQKYLCFCSFMYQLYQAGVGKVTVSVFESSCHCYYQSNHSTVEAILLSALPKDTSELAGLFYTLSLFMLNVKQGSCEYQTCYVFGLTRRENRRRWNGKREKILILNLSICKYFLFLTRQLSS